VAGLRAAFDAELARGEGFQRDYQDYEAAQIAAGVPISDPHLFDAFYAGREPIASPVGPEEWFVWVPKSKMSAQASRWGKPWGLFGAGVAAMSTALISAARSRWSSAKGKRRPDRLDEAEHLEL
jgi:hypothetical protein